jgi:hypothetical protein
VKKVIVAIAVIVAAGVATWSSHKVPDIKAHAAETFEQNGFKVVGYEGYQSGAFDTYGGMVWYIVERNGVTYTAGLAKWKDEYQIYSLKALDAIGAQRAK